MSRSRWLQNSLDCLLRCVWCSKAEINRSTLCKGYIRSVRSILICYKEFKRLTAIITGAHWSLVSKISRDETSDTFIFFCIAIVSVTGVFIFCFHTFSTMTSTFKNLFLIEAWKTHPFCLNRSWVYQGELINKMTTLKLNQLNKYFFH